VANRESEMIHYEGHVRAWHGTDVIESPVLDLNQKRHLLSSDAGVVTSHVQPASKPATDPRQASRSDEASALTIRADRLAYFDQEHRAHYAGNAELVTEDTRLRADVLDLYFSAPDNGSQNSQVERAVAAGHVRVTQPLRYAEGTRAVYDARAGKIVLTGGPPTLYDQEKGLISGQRLTFYVHDDRLQVEGGYNSPTVSKHRVAP
jgi:lipopolysaccharide export system protein LptA